MTSEFGIIGLGVMGKGLALNFARQKIKLSLFNRHVTHKEVNIAKNFILENTELKGSEGFDDLNAFVSSLQIPRKILIMVNAGPAVDSVINSILPLLKSDDILIDGGNSHYLATNARMKLLKIRDIHFIGMGVSGGEKGALLGPSLMPGGAPEAYKKVERYLQSIAAKNLDNKPCCNYMGPEGAGHFVKMVHNGIEYAEMQLIAEVYSILRYINRLDPTEISEIFEQWNTGSLQNYLLESSALILKKKDKNKDQWLIDFILDKASHKGTGSWTTIAAAELGIPFTMSSAALNARYISALKESRALLSEIYNFDKIQQKPINLDTLKNAYQVARIVNHHQGFLLIQGGSNANDWNINLKNVAHVWTNGCIIASQLMLDLTFILNGTDSILESNVILKIVNSNFSDLKKTVMHGIKANLPLPCFSEGLNFITAICQGSGTGNIIQAQRDFFGAHTYKRIDDPEGNAHHTNWTE